MWAPVDSDYPPLYFRYMVKRLVAVALIAALMAPASSASAVPIVAPVKACLEKAIGKSATRSIERARRLSTRQLQSVQMCERFVKVPFPAAAGLPPGTGSVFDLDPALSAIDIANIQEWTNLAIYAHQAFLGVTVSAFTTNVSRNPAWLAERYCLAIPHPGCVSYKTSLYGNIGAEAGCSPTSVEAIGSPTVGDEFVCLHSSNFANLTKDHLKVFIHEVHHIHQWQEHRDWSSLSVIPGTVRSIGPEWLNEGGAEYIGYFMLAELGRTSMDQVRREWRSTSNRIRQPLSEFETTVIGRRVNGNAYHLYAIAVEELLKLTGNTPQSLTRYYQLLGEKVVWPAAFQQAFGISIQDFYTHFQRVRPR